MYGIMTKLKENSKNAIDFRSHIDGKIYEVR